MISRKVELITTNERQTTLARAGRLQGYSVKDFQPCEAELLPAAADTGIVFEMGETRLPATTDFLLENGPTHTTGVTAAGRVILTVEHFLAAVRAAGLDNLLVRVGERGLPLPDFAAVEYWKVLGVCGRTELAAPRRVLTVRTEMRWEAADDEGRFAVVRPGEAPDEEILRARVIFEEPVGDREVEYRHGQTDFGKELAPARSFVPHGLDAERWAKVRQRYPVLPEDPKLSPLVVFAKGAFITPPRFPDEPTRHKMVDLIGDLALAGYRVRGNVFVSKPGHRFNAALARRLREEAGL